MDAATLSPIAPPRRPSVGHDAFFAELVDQGLVSPQAAAQARTLVDEAGMSAVSALLRLNAISEGALYGAYARHCGVAQLDESATSALLDGTTAVVDALGLSPAWLKLKGVAVLARSDGDLVAAFRDELPADVATVIERKAALAGRDLGWAVVAPSEFDALAIGSAAASSVTEVGTDDLRTLRELAEEGPTIELVNSILSQAVLHRASDVHVEPEEAAFIVRTRVDGEMLLQSRQPRSGFEPVVCRLKILAELDIAERRLPQDGRINAKVNGEVFDIRVSILPGALGESIVLRLLRQERKPTRLEHLGMTPAQAHLFGAWTRMANGIVLVTGPTGSGKSTTLYTALELANDNSKKIITVEDPVEYKIRGLTQLQVNADIGFTFASALRSILRHDPDVILVGEIRDEETARIAIQSSLTGHLVMSTLHTNSAIGAVTRLVDMGIEPFLIAASVRGLMAQRLVRRLCKRCSADDLQPDEATATLAERWQHRHPDQSLRLKRAVGCSECAGTGYFGRFAIYDLIEVDREMAHRITRGLNEGELLPAPEHRSDTGLLASGLAFVAAGETTLAEVLRATGES